ncbi:MAG: glycosyltransferase, partial [Nanoarchaeota archaeon]|nr:glycosyltransferase [Nanoarchaeota archaeon]
IAHRLKEEDCKDEDIKVGPGIIKIRYTPPQRKGIKYNPAIYFYRLMITSVYLYRLAKEENAEIIVVGETELLASILLKLLKIKIVCRGGALMYETMKTEVIKEKGNTLYSRIFILLLFIYNEFTLKLPNAMVPVNKAEYSFMDNKKRKNAKILTIPHGIDTSFFRPSKKKAGLKLHVGYVGRLAPIKNPEVALDIFKEASENVKNIEFWWIGPIDPSYDSDFFEKLKKQKGVKNAYYLGQISNTKLPKYLNELDIFIQVEQQKNVSRSTTEAAACGLPIVALNQGNEPYGLFSMDKKIIINELRKLIREKNYRTLSGNKNRKIIEENYSEDKIYGRYLNLFKEIV